MNDGEAGGETLSGSKETPQEERRQGGRATAESGVDDAHLPQAPPS